jgi:hypothetical protein
MPENPADKRLTGILAVCLRELMDDLGAEPAWLPECQPSGDSEELLAASVGFDGNNLRGTVVLVGQPRVFARLYPFPTTHNPPDLADWAREMANQAVGRFKNRLLAYGLTVSVGQPQSAPAEELRVARKKKLIEIPMAMGIEDMRLDALIEFEVGPGFELAEQPVTQKGPALAEGSMVLF